MTPVLVFSVLPCLGNPCHCCLCPVIPSWWLDPKHTHGKYQAHPGGYGDLVVLYSCCDVHVDLSLGWSLGLGML